MKVKICGITHYEDAIRACELGADALGFVFYKKSPRYIEPIKAQEIIAKLPPFVERVGLFVHENEVTIDSIATMCQLSLVQLHWNVSSSFVTQTKALHVQRVEHPHDLNTLRPYSLVDAYVDNYGGAGKRIPLEWFDHIDCSHLILAGGLQSHLLADVKTYGFYGVDVSSGVEHSKGKKDWKKMEEFITLAKN